jgi:hypothetical protein
MSILRVLIWKEWRETQALLLIALGIFVGLPIIGAIEGFAQYSRRFGMDTSSEIFVFGGLFAVIVGVGVTCHDLQGKLEDFWRSCPISTLQWMLVKYCFGLCVILGACTLPLLLQLLTNHKAEYIDPRDNNVLYLAVWFPFLWAVSYSVGFCAGCLVRRMTHAAILAMATLLLIYYLPTLFPPVAWMNFAFVAESWLQETWLQTRATEFAAAMIGITIFFLLISLWIVQRGWWIESAQKLVYAAVSLAILILAASSAYKLGTNLPILQQLDLHGDQVVWLNFHGLTGYAGISTPITDNQKGYVENFRYIRRIVITPRGITLGPRIAQASTHWTPRQLELEAPDHPEISYDVYYDDNNQLHLQVLKNGTPDHNLGIEWKTPQPESLPAIYASQNRLYGLGDSQLLLMDITQPSVPTVISKTSFRYDLPASWQSFGGRQVTIILPEIPGLKSPQRLDLALSKLRGLLGRWDQDVVVQLRDDAIGEYRLVKRSDTKANYDFVARYDRTFVERMFGGYADNTARTANGMLYTIQHGYGDEFLNPYVTVLSLGGDHPLRVLGHFAAPGLQTIYPLPDGRAVGVGTKIWLIGPPPRHD